MIPTDAIIKLIPELRQFATGVPARDPSLSAQPHSGKPAPTPEPRTARELADWLGEEPSGPRPSALLVATKGEPRRDMAVREALVGADLAVDAAGRTTGALIDEALERLGLPDAHQDELRGWLTGVRAAPQFLLDSASGTHAETRVRDTRKTSSIRLTVAVHGVDLAAEPHALVNVLVLLQNLGCRVLAVCHHDAGSVWQRAARDLLVPTLRRTAWALIQEVSDLERRRRRHHRIEGAGNRSAEVAPDRVCRLQQLRCQPDPGRQMNQLRQLTGQLRTDVARLRAEVEPDDGNPDPDEGGRT